MRNNILYHLTAFGLGATMYLFAACGVTQQSAVCPPLPPPITVHDTTKTVDIIYVDSVRFDTVVSVQIVNYPVHDTLAIHDTLRVNSTTSILPFVVLYPDPSGDSWLLLQTAIDNYINAKAGWPLLMPGTYRISQPLLAAKIVNGDYGQVSLHIEGYASAKNTPAQYLAHITPMYADRFTLGIQKGKGCAIANIAFDGPFALLSTFTTLQIDTLPLSAWADGKVSINRTSPTSGVVIDPFSSSENFDSVKYQMYKGFEAKYLPIMSRGGSTAIQITGCSFGNFVVGVMITPSNQANAEEIDVIDCSMQSCVAAYACTQTQSKTNTITRMQVWNHVHTIIDGHHFGFAHSDGSTMPMVDVINVAGTNHELVCGGTNPFAAVLSKVYAEGLFKIGYIGGYSGVSFKDCQIDFQSSAPGTPSPDTYFQGQYVSWDNCMLRIYNGGTPGFRFPWGGQDNFFTGGTIGGPPISGPNRLSFTHTVGYYGGPLILTGTGGWDSTGLVNNVSLYCDRTTFTGYLTGLKGVQVGDIILTAKRNDEDTDIISDINIQYIIGNVASVSGDTTYLQGMGMGIQSGMYSAWINRLKQ